MSGLAALLSACEQRGEVEPGKTATEGAESTVAREPVRTPAELVVSAMISDPEQLVGRRVVFDVALVQAVGDTAMFVGPTPTVDRAVLVVPVDPRMASGIEVGERVQVRGVIKKMPPPSWATGLPGDEPAIERAQRANLRIYVEAEKLQAPAEPIG